MSWIPCHSSEPALRGLSLPWRSRTPVKGEWTVRGRGPCEGPQHEPVQRQGTPGLENTGLPSGGNSEPQLWRIPAVAPGSQPSLPAQTCAVLAGSAAEGLGTNDPGSGLQGEAAG